ncbi:MAG TPA: hypothetical protein VFD13_00010 [Candidatus Kapabacteria bacterium]|nr:hypothetical protein [Candidatus Kapabacteria bacterium]
MKNSFRTFASLALISCFVLFGSVTAHAQFSRPVIVMKGCVLTADQKPATVRLSIHETGAADNDTSDEITTCAIQEITAGRANSQSGRYLLILKPNTKYWVHIEGTFVQSIDTLITMPNTQKPLTIDQNFMVNWRTATDPATMGANDAPAKKE